MLGTSKLYCKVAFASLYALFDLHLCHYINESSQIHNPHLVREGGAKVKLRTSHFTWKKCVETPLHVAWKNVVDPAFFRLLFFHTWKPFYIGQFHRLHSDFTSPSLMFIHIKKHQEGLQKNYEAHAQTQKGQARLHLVGNMIERISI